MSERGTITLDWAWLKRQFSDAVFNFFLPWRSFPKMRRMVRRAMRDGPHGPDLGRMTHAERDKHLFGIEP